MSYVKCHCGHGKDVHNTGLDCSIGNCDCVLYRPETAADPFANDHRQNANKLLTFARESEAGKVKRLGARIEALLEELALAAEDEIAEKVQREKTAAEMEALLKRAEKARAELEATEARLAELSPKKKVRTMTKLSMCEICGKSFLNVGAHKNKAHR